MRWIGWILLILAAVGLLAAVVPPPGAPSSAAGGPVWRRTVEGWQRADWLTAEVPHWRPDLHPCVVGLLELFLSIAALAVFPQKLRNL